MPRLICAALAFLCVLVIASPASARHRHSTHLRHHQQEYVTQLTVGDSWMASDSRYGAIPSVEQPRRERHHGPVMDAHGNRAVANGEVHYLPHPPGVRRTQFCGAGAWYALTGQVVNGGTWAIADYWPGHYHGSTPVAHWPGHVAIIRQNYGNGTALMEDYNSGGHKSRLWVRSLAGARIIGG